MFWMAILVEAGLNIGEICGLVINASHRLLQPLRVAMRRITPLVTGSCQDTPFSLHHAFTAMSRWYVQSFQVSWLDHNAVIGVC